MLSWWAIFALLLVRSCTSHGRALSNIIVPEDAYKVEEIIPTDRRIEWSHAGIPGGIPNRTIICSTIDSAVYGNGTTDATAAIQSALDNCPDGHVVFLPEGIYLTSDTIHLDDYDTLRGAGPGKTVLKYTGGYLRSMVDMRGLIYWQIAGLHKTYDVLAANKDSNVITLASTAGISQGDILLINQLNDNDLVDPVGVEGKCTYCGYEDGDRVLGQLVEVTAVNGNQVTLNLPLHWTYAAALDPWAYQVDADAMIRYAGLEDLTFTQDDPEVEFVIEMDGAQYSWVKNVEIENIQRRAMWVIELAAERDQGVLHPHRHRRLRARPRLRAVRRPTQLEQPGREQYLQHHRRRGHHDRRRRFRQRAGLQLPARHPVRRSLVDDRQPVDQPQPAPQDEPVGREFRL